METKDRLKYIKQYRILNKGIRKREFLNRVHFIEIIVYKKIEEYVCLFKSLNIYFSKII